MIFVDTSFFVALLDPRDENHTRAVEAFETFQNRRLKDLLLTTNNVVLETITVARYEADASRTPAARRDAKVFHALEGTARPDSIIEARTGLQFPQRSSAPADPPLLWQPPRTCRRSGSAQNRRLGPRPPLDHHEHEDLTPLY